HSYRLAANCTRWFLPRVEAARAAASHAPLVRRARATTPCGGSPGTVDPARRRRGEYEHGPRANGGSCQKAGSLATQFAEKRPQGVGNEGWLFADDKMAPTWQLLPAPDICVAPLHIAPRYALNWLGAYLNDAQWHLDTVWDLWL